MMRALPQCFVGLMVLAMLCCGCAVRPEGPGGDDVLAAQVRQTITIMKIYDPNLERFFDRSYGYAVLPRIFKGAFVLGGAHGRGQVFEQGKLVGYCDVSQATVGFSFGGEYFREIVFLRDREDFEAFTADEYTFSAQATAVAVQSSGAAKADYKAGMAVFVDAEEGLMVDASVGGQKFRYVPLGANE